MTEGAKNGDLTAVKRWLPKIVRAVNRDNRPLSTFKTRAFHSAAFSGHIDVTKELCLSGLYPNWYFPSWADKSALDVAIEQRHETIAQHLVNCGRKYRKDGQSLAKRLNAAAARGMVGITRTLLDNGAPINATSGPEDKTPFEMAVWWNHPAVIRLLMERGADVVVVEAMGWKALNSAIHRGPIPVVNLLLGYLAKIDCQNKNIAYQGGFFGAIINNKAAIAELLLSTGYVNIDWKDPSNGQTQGETALHLAVRLRKVDIVKILIQNKADLEARNRTNVTPLRIAVQNRDQNMVALLLKAGADANARAENHATVFMEALTMRDMQIAQVFIDNGANVDVLTYRGLKLVHLAAERDDDIDILRFLLDNGADINATPKRGIWTPLMGAAQRDQMVTMHELLNRGADHGIQTDSDSYTALHFATRNRNLEAVGLLLAYGAIQKKSQYGLPIEIANQLQQYEIVDLLHEYSTIEPSPFVPFTERLWRPFCDPALCPPVTEVPPKDVCPRHPDLPFDSVPKPATPTLYYPLQSARSQTPTAFPTTYPSTLTTTAPASRSRTPSHNPLLASHFTDPYGHQHDPFAASRASPSFNSLAIPVTAPSAHPRTALYMPSQAPLTTQLYQPYHTTPPTFTALPDLRSRAASFNTFPPSMPITKETEETVQPYTPASEVGTALTSTHSGQWDRAPEHRRSYDLEDTLDDASMEAHWDTQDDARSLPEVEERDNNHPAGRTKLSSEREDMCSQWLSTLDS